MEIKAYLEELRKGCGNEIYSGSMNGYEEFGTGWKCGEKARHGIILYCKPCWEKIEKLESKLEKELK